MIQTLDLDPAALRAEIERLRREVMALRERAEFAEAMAGRDVLTPALNRRGFIEAVSRQMHYCQRHGVEAVLLYIDMDDFKPLNDSLGHAAGDAALIAVAEMLIEHTRDSDVIGRLGGDEFAIVMMHTSTDDGRAKAELLSRQLNDKGFEWEGKKHSLSASIGVRALGYHSEPEVWLAEADAAMWLRKAEKGTHR